MEPKGAFYAFPDVSAYVGRRTPKGAVIADDLALCEHLVEAAGIAVVPGVAFHASGFIRLSYATSRANIATGVRRLADALARLE